MPAERYYFDSPFTQLQKLTLIEGEFHHLVHVMRTAVGETIELVNGKGQLATAQVSKLTKRDAEIEIQSIHQEPKPTKELILIQAIPRPNRLDFVVEKGTELGMTQLWLFPSHLSDRKILNPSHLERIHGLSAAAMKQCGRLYMPEIKIVDDINSWALPSGIPGFFGDVNPNAPHFLEKLKPNNSGFLFATGPESGFTDKEEKQLRSKGLLGVKLHWNILRTDTASIAALSILSQY